MIGKGAWSAGRGWGPYARRVGESLDILVATTFGLEAVAARELADLGYSGAKGVSTGRVLFRGDARAVARANVRLRTADRVLVRLASFPCRDFDTLFETVKGLEWEEWIPREYAFPVDGRSVKSQLSSVPAVQRTVKKAVVERLMRGHRARELPETGPRVGIEVSLLNDVATITVDTSGEGLHKRGYRAGVGEASLKETLAAGLVLLSVWRPERPLIDPFCGTGTIAIEAAMWARGMAPGVGRGFDAERWPWIGEGVWREAREEARAGATGTLKHTIHGYDLDERGLAVARESARRAGVEREIHFAKRDFAELSSGLEYGCVITNPPYGKRLGDEVATAGLYASMPAVFRRLPTWSFHVLTARLDLEDVFGVRASRRRKLYNSTIECTYFTFLGPRPAGAEGPGEPGVLEGADVEGGEEAGPIEGASAFVGVGLRERDERELADFAGRLSKNVRHLRRYPERGIHCYRVYERDCPDVPLIVDVYEDHAHVVEYEREHSRTATQQALWWERARRIVAESLEVPLAQVHAKEKRRQRAGGQHEKLGDRGRTLLVREGGLRFEVNLDDYVDTGLFLDHRLTRGTVREQASGKRFLNLFCYTGAFTVYAASGGAASTTSVDLSNTYLEWAWRNLEHNGLAGARHRMVRSDVLEFLGRHARPAGGVYDLVVVDPPTFSRSKATEEDWEVAVDHAELFRRLSPLLSPGAVVYFSTNFRRFALDEAVLGELGMSWREISGQTVPPEYRNRRIHRCWRIVAGG